MDEAEPTAREIEAMILHKLARRGAWGEAYVPHDTLIRHMAKKIKRDEKQVRKIMDSLLQQGFLIPHKGGNTVSLNPSRRAEILRILEDFLS